MSSDSNCDRCKVGILLDLDMDAYDWDTLPEDVDKDKLVRIQQCSQCGIIVFYVGGCESCGEWECNGTGIGNSDRVH